MSFTQEVKQEITKIELIDSEKISLLSAIIHNSIINEDCIRIVSESNNVIRYIYSLIKSTYNITPKIIVRRGYNYKKTFIHILEIYKEKDIILSDLGILNNKKISLIPSEYIVDDEELLRKYLTGLFLISGSINDPKKSRYHLEFIANNLEYAKFVVNILNHFNLNSKYLKRENKYMVYIKEAEKIGDFLRMVGAINGLFYYEDIRIYRDHKNMTNRLNNCEQANVDKTILVATNQINDIKIILDAGGLELLDEKEQVVANYRLKYQEASLLELSDIISIETGKKITKSGVNHRFNKIKLLAQRIKDSKK